MYTKTFGGAQLENISRWGKWIVMHNQLLYWVIKESINSWCFTRFFFLFNWSLMNHQVFGEYSSDDLLITQWSPSSLINFFRVMMHPKKTLCQSRKLNGDVDTGCNHFCCFYLIFTVSWWKIVMFIVLGLLAMSIPFVVYCYCRFYKKQDNNAVTVQQGTENCSGSSEDQKTISPSFNASFSCSTESIRMRITKDTVEAPLPPPHHT